MILRVAFSVPNRVSEGQPSQAKNAAKAQLGSNELLLSYPSSIVQNYASPPLKPDSAKRNRIAAALSRKKGLKLGSDGPSRSASRGLQVIESLQ